MMPTTESRVANGSISTPRICILGAGVSGLCAGIKLKTKLGITSFTILEEHDDIGGTWLANTYPGCACDVESHLYSYSFEPNPFWSAHFSPQPEIWEYLQNVAKKYGLYSYIQFNTRVKSMAWDDVHSKWRMVTVGSNNSNQEDKHLEFDIVINGPGGLRVPNYPPEFMAFKGPLMHSAEWNPGIDLKDKVVAVIGSGASAIQVVPNVAKDVAELHVYQRHAPYVVPRRQYQYSKFIQNLFFYIPFFLWLYRCFLFLTHEAFLRAFKGNTFMNWIAGQMSNSYLKKCIEDPILRQKLKPNYKFGCKRVMVSDDFYQTFNLSNVKLNTNKIVKVNHDSITTADGETQKIDVLILCTGFRVQEYFAPMEVYVRNNINALDAWRPQGPQTYYGITCHGAPNHFILLGPNTGLGHNSAIYMIECQANFAMNVIREMIRRKAKTVEVKESVQKEFMDKLEKEMKHTIWGVESCGSWYANENGKVTALWPEGCISYWFKTTFIDFSKFEFKYGKETDCSQN